MRKLIITFLFVLTLFGTSLAILPPANLAFAQTYGGATVPYGTTAPATCANIGDLFWDSDDDLLYICDPVDTWTVVGSEQLGAHASQHIPSGSDPVEPWLWGGALTVSDKNPPVESGYVYDCTGWTTVEATSVVENTWYRIVSLGTTADWTVCGGPTATGVIGTIFEAGASACTGTGTTSVVIEDFFDSGDDNHSGFTSGKSRFRVWMNNQYASILFNSNAEIEGNAGQNFTGSNSDLVLLEFLYLDTGWQCTNFTSGFSTPTTLAIDKAQFDYTIANPQAIIIGTDLTAGSDDITIGTEITSSTVYLTSDSDDDTDTLVLQVAGAGYDGAKLTFVTKAGFDAPGDAVIIDMADAICNDGGCPYSASFTLRGIGATLTLTWDSTTASWWLENFYQPPVDFYTDADHKTTIVGIDEFGSSTFVEYSIKNDMVTVLFRIVGEEAGTTPVTITAPYTSKERSDAGMLVVFPVFAVNGTTTPGGGWGVCGLSNNSVAITCYPPLDHGVDYSGSWGTDGNEVRAIQGEFYYVAE